VITISEAEARVDRRLTAAAGGDPDTPGPFRGEIYELAPLSCAGSSVTGPELAEHVRRETLQLVARAVDGEPLGGLVAGVILQSFWLGWEHRGAES
jgi:hypothetical protein